MLDTLGAKGAELKVLIFVMAAAWVQAQTPPAIPPAPAGFDHSAAATRKAADNLLWYQMLGGVADIDIVQYTGLPPAKIPNPTGQGAGNPVIVTAYTFLLKKLDRTKNHPFLIYSHGGVHANFNTSSAHIVRELVEQGYCVIAPDYRGSTGYGRGYYELIDFGGREVDDVYRGRQWMLDTHAFLDPQRVGLIGWSHGGLITLMNLFEDGGEFAAGYAGIPVSDLVARMGYKNETYRRLYSAPYHIGKTAEENVGEYLKRSPVEHAAKLRTPLLIHTNTNDEDVNVLEVRRLITALKAEGKQFEYKIYEDAPGGHAFNRIDTPLARESRKEAYAFLAKYLKP
ncbi:MAG: alpha/beta fold hydrolase [Acidobacteriota bacterium]